MRELTFPRLTGTLIAAAMVAGVTHQIYSSYRSGQFRPDGFQHHRHACSTGNVINYYRREGLPGGPTVVFESGLMHTSVAWLLICDHLAPDISVVVYDRAGYRKSLRRSDKPYTFGESVSDLVDIVGRATEGDGPVYLVGHSLGGYLAHLAASRLSDEAEPGVRRSIGGVILIDPTHPQELVVSHSQREGARGVNATMKLGPVTTILGGGLLVDKRSLFEYCEGSPYYRALRYEASSFTCVQTAKREWDHSYSLLLDGGRPVQDLPSPVAVLAAEVTLAGIPEQKDLFDEYVASGTGGEVAVVPESDHITITGSIDCAPRTASMVEQLVRDWSRSAATTAPAGAR